MINLRYKQFATINNRNNLYTFCKLHFNSDMLYVQAIANNLLTFSLLL